MLHMRKGKQTLSSPSIHSYQHLSDPGKVQTHREEIL